jgi:hypothetical protein
MTIRIYDRVRFVGPRGLVSSLDRRISATPLRTTVTVTARSNYPNQGCSFA